jgi:hypothetical protein
LSVDTVDRREDVRLSFEHTHSFTARQEIAMELPLAATTLTISEPSQLFAGIGRAGKASGLEAATADYPRQPAKHFDDILGQTLAGPLFATWTPVAPVNPVAAGSSTGSSTTAPIDPNARRDGRRRSRR